MIDSPDRDEQGKAWDLLYGRLVALVQQIGTEDILRTADCWVDDDNLATRQQKVYVRNLEMLRPPVVSAMQRLLAEFPAWEIMVAVSVPGQGDKWPEMGITVRAHEIIDGLQRQYFPPEFRDIRYEGSRPGTDRD